MEREPCIQKESGPDLNVDTFIQKQEEARNRLSHELHNGVGQALYSIVLGLQIIRGKDLDEQMSRHIGEMRNIASQALHTVKDIVFELRPLMLDDLGVIPAVRSYIEMTRQKYGKQIELEVLDEIRRYHTSTETALYRICEEAVALMIYCTRIRRMVLCFQHDKGHIQLDITAVGCVASRAYEREDERIAYTIASIRARAGQAGGYMNICTDTDNWTKLSIIIPLSHPNESEGGCV